MHCLYFPSIPNVLFFIFICFFYFSNPEPEKRERGQAFRQRLDSCARFRSTRRVFREGLFESGKVIFALHDTKWLSYVRIKYLTSAAFIYHMYTYFSIAISMICIFYILYAIWSLNIDMHSHSNWKHTFCFWLYMNWSCGFKVFFKHYAVLLPHVSHCVFFSYAIEVFVCAFMIGSSKGIVTTY